MPVLLADIYCSWPDVNSFTPTGLHTGAYVWLCTSTNELIAYRYDVQAALAGDGIT